MSRSNPVHTYGARVLVMLGALAGACSESDATGPDVDAAPQSIRDIIAPAPLLVGTDVRVIAAVPVARPTLRIVADHRTLEVAASSRDGVESVYRIPAHGPSTLGVGSRSVDAFLVDGGYVTPPRPWVVHVATDIAVGPPSLRDGPVVWDEPVVVEGSGFIWPSEGTQLIALVGTYRTTSDDVYPVDVRFDLEPLEPLSRDRAVFRLGRRFGSVEPGVFEGTAQILTTLRTGYEPTSPLVPARIEVQPRAVTEVRPIAFSVGRYLDVLGNGLPTDPATPVVVRLAGDYRGTFRAGTAEFDVVPETYPWGLRLVVPPVAGPTGVHCDWFDDPAGVFRGSVSVAWEQPDGVAEEAAPINVQLVLAPPVQVVHVRFGDGFDASLERFGIAEARDRVVLATLRRLGAIWGDYRVEFVPTEPGDWAPVVISTLEIGGRDPSGVGMFAHDLEAGKDSWNLSMNDPIGGAYAGQLPDGHRGYGGVFVEDVLAWSTAPDVRGDRPSGAPDPDPLFDSVFGPVQERPVTAAEAAGVGDAERLEAIAAAVDALGNLLGEAAAHQLGHAVGLGDPTHVRGPIHDETDEPGCLMDADSDRPFGERAALDGFEPTRFCHDAPAYLSTILGR